MDELNSFRLDDLGDEVNDIEREEMLLSSFNEETRAFIKKAYRVEGRDKPLKQYIEEFNPAFDVRKMRARHNEQRLMFNNEPVFIDEKLVGLFKLINRDHLLTTMSCQYNGRGYAMFCFSFLGYDYWLEVLSHAARCYVHNMMSEEEKALNDDDISTLASDMLIVKRFRDHHQSSSNRLIFQSEWYSGRHQLELSVQWCFLQEDIPEIEKAIAALYEAKEKYDALAEKV